MSEPFLGEIRMFGGNFAPRGWALCDGQLLPIAQNSALFSIFGTTYGGDGRETFALPDLRDRAAMHAGSGPGMTQRRLGERLGVDAVTLTVAQIPNHVHQLRGSSAEADEDSPVGNVPATPEERVPYDDAHDMPMTPLPSAGGGQAHGNRQPYLCVNFTVALVGLFPARS